MSTKKQKVRKKPKVRELLAPAELNTAKLIVAIEKTPVVREWPEGDRYMEAEQCEAIAHEIIGPLHGHLMKARIGFVFQEQMNRRGRYILAKASKATGAVAFLSRFDFVISFNWTMWKDMDARMRCALVDHELEHCGRDDESGTFVTLPHDIEEFGSIVRRWGLWKADLVSFAQIVKVQLELFTEAKK